MTAFKLKPYQKDILSRLKNGSILVGGVGSGKSVTSIAYFITKVCGGSLDFTKEKNILKSPKDLYIITTAKKRDSLEWEKDCSYFMISKEPAATIGNIKLTIDSWNNISKYTDVENAFFIFDEQRVIGWGSWSKNFLQITRKNQWILLSATPGDVWMDYLPVFLANGFYKNKTEFLRKHVVFNRIVSYPKIDRYLETALLEKHRRSILVVMDYQSKAKQHHKYITTDYNLFNFSLVFKEKWNYKEQVPVKTKAEYGYLLREICNSDESRIDAVLKLVKEFDKTIIFYNFNYELELLREMCTKNGLIFSEWNGFFHQPIPDSETWVYLVQYTSGSEGWNCIETNRMIFYSPNYSYRTIKQASGRIDRMNTPFTDLYYYHFKTESEIDRMIFKAIKNKKTFNENSLNF